MYQSKDMQNYFIIISFCHRVGITSKCWASLCMLWILVKHARSLLSQISKTILRPPTCHSITAQSYSQKLLGHHRGSGSLLSIHSQLYSAKQYSITVMMQLLLQNNYELLTYCFCMPYTCRCRPSHQDRNIPCEFVLHK